MYETKHVKLIHSLWITLWISPFLLPISTAAFGWGDFGHRLVAEYAATLLEPQVLKNCQITSAQLMDHVNDPDSIWKQQRFKYPHERSAHFFDLEKQPPDWKKRKEAANRDEGYLVYRIVDWTEEAKKFRKEKNWPKLNERLYGLAHYLGDISQPLHLHDDYDGKAAGLPGIHAQFETKMLNRYRDDVRRGVLKRLSKEKIPAHFLATEYRDLIFNIAEQSNKKAPRMLESAKSALIVPKFGKKKTAKPIVLRFVKAKLWEATGELALDQLALSSRLLAHTLNIICR